MVLTQSTGPGLLGAMTADGEKWGRGPGHSLSLDTLVCATYWEGRDLPARVTLPSLHS